MGAANRHAINGSRFWLGRHCGRADLLCLCEKRAMRKRFSVSVVKKIKPRAISSANVPDAVSFLLIKRIALIYIEFHKC